MSLLLDPLPDYVTVDGADYPVVTGWRAWAKLSDLLSDPHTGMAQQMIAVLSMYCDTLPTDQMAAVQAIIVSIPK